MSKSILQIICSFSVEKTAQKNTKYSRNPHFASKIKIPKDMSKSILQIILSFSVQKTAQKTTKDHFENQPSCKGYSPCKILNLG